MSEKPNEKNGGPAFPNQIKITDEAYSELRGMTLRDYFAAAALQGLCANSYASGTSKPLSEATGKELAGMSYGIADSMLAARK